MADCSLKGLSVLIVEDDADAREMLAHAIVAFGAEVRVAENAEQARGLLEARQPDVILSDIGMPNEDGCSLMRSIRTGASGEQADVPAIALSAFATPTAREDALRAGFDVYVVKPVQPWVLAQLLREITSVPSSRAPAPSVER